MKALVLEGFSVVSESFGWTLYLNGKSKGTVTKDIVADKGRAEDLYDPLVKNAFCLGHHANDPDFAHHTCLGRFDYWRISDEVLKPAQFLTGSKQ